MITIFKQRSVGILSAARSTLLFLGVSLLTACLLIPDTGSPKSNAPLPATDRDFGNIIINVWDDQYQPMLDGVVVQVSDSIEADDKDNGEFRLGSCDPPHHLIVWAPGYQTRFIPCDGSNTYDIRLDKLNLPDNPNYSWIAAGFQSDFDPYCGSCHAGQFNGSYNELNEWRKSGHAKVFGNRFLETMYLGTNMNGNKSPDTRWEIMSNRLVRRAPVMDASYFGPGFKLDFPYQNGKCAYCHVPASITGAMTDVNLASLFPSPGGSIGEGITCDVCHKALGMVLDENRFPFVDRPGILSFQFVRPLDGTRFYTGPLINTIGADPPSHQSTCSTIFSQSEFCAACHYGKFEDMTIYNSYGEWRESKYGDDPNQGDYATCQDCHMPPRIVSGSAPIASRDVTCSANTVGYQDFNHNMMNFGVDQRSDSGREIPLMIKEAASLDATFTYEPDIKNSLKVTVRARNTKAGHKFPTDSPLRHLILLVEAKDQFGNPLAQVDGDRIPNWAGLGNSFLDAQGVKSYGGLPGKIFAYLLVEKDTNLTPTAAYWNQTKLVYENEKPKENSDTRLAPGKPDLSDYYFSVPSNGEITLTATLIYRFAFYDLMMQKGWSRPDIIVTSIICTGNATSPDSMQCRDRELRVP